MRRCINHILQRQDTEKKYARTEQHNLPSYRPPQPETETKKKAGIKNRPASSRKPGSSKTGQAFTKLRFAPYQYNQEQKRINLPLKQKKELRTSRRSSSSRVYARAHALILYKHTETIFLHSPRTVGENSTTVEKRNLVHSPKGARTTEPKEKLQNAPKGRNGKGGR